MLNFVLFCLTCYCSIMHILLLLPCGLYSIRAQNGYGQRRPVYKKLKNVSCECDRLNGWNSTLQAAWYIRRVRIIWFLWTKPTIWLLILSFTQNIVRACSMFYPYEGYKSVTPLDAARVNRTIFHNHSVHWYYITLIKGRDYIKHDINVRHGKQNPRRAMAIVRTILLHYMINRRVVITLESYYYRYLLYLLWYFDASCITCCWGLSAMFTGGGVRFHTTVVFLIQ